MGRIQEQDYQRGWDEGRNALIIEQENQMLVIRITSQQMTPGGILTKFSDGTTEVRSYKYDPKMDGVDGCNGYYMDMFPWENDLSDMALRVFEENQT